MTEDNVVPITPPEQPIVIYKYPLLLTAVQSIEMPVGAGLLTVQMQYDQPVIWARHKRGGDTEWRRIEMAMTGDHPSSAEGPWIATIQTQSMVFHFFDGGIEDLGVADVPTAV